MTKRIVVTGMGVVSCLGHDIDTFYNKLLAGESGITNIERFPCEDYSTRIAGEIKEFDPAEYIDKKQARRLDLCISYGIVAAKKAMIHAQATEEITETWDKHKCGVLLGSGMGGMTIFSQSIENLITKSYKRISPFYIPYTITNMSGAILAIEYGFMGPNYSISTACATANYCITAAAEHIRKGDADVMICGGTEAALVPVGLGGFIACKALSQNNQNPTKASRPWDKNRDGFVMGEGAGVLILESEEHAKKRGAKIYAEYLGGAMSCDAHHMTTPREDGLGAKMCMQRALDDANITAEQVNYVNAHATSTSAGDMAEINAINDIFGKNKNLKINGTKSMTGHSLGAAGGLEAIATIKAINTGKIHPTINLDEPEPGVMELGASTKAEEHDVTAAISNAFGFGGHNGSVIFAKYE